jgi:hypothetical protein
MYHRWAQAAPYSGPRPLLATRPIAGLRAGNLMSLAWRDAELFAGSLLGTRFGSINVRYSRPGWWRPAALGRGRP